MYEVRRATREDLATCLQIRREVFIEGQGVPEHLEVDGRDDACAHFLALADDTAAGTARLWITGDGTAKVERVAVRARFRGRGLGHALMKAVEDEARRLGHQQVVLGAQIAVLAFYESRGYVAEGPVFMDADIPHRKMRLTLRSSE